MQTHNITALVAYLLIVFYLRKNNNSWNYWTAGSQQLKETIVWFALGHKRSDPWLLRPDVRKYCWPIVNWKHDVWITQSTSSKVLLMLCNWMSFTSEEKVEENMRMESCSEWALQGRKHLALFSCPPPPPALPLPGNSILTDFECVL